MTKTTNEYLPFADIEDDQEEIEWMQSMVESRVNEAYKDKVIDESNYIRLSADVGEIYGHPYDHFGRIAEEIRDAYEVDLLDKLVKGGEFIDNTPSDDPRYSRAVAKYDRLSEQFRNYKERTESA